MQDKNVGGKILNNSIRKILRQKVMWSYFLKNRN